MISALNMKTMTKTMMITTMNKYQINFFFEWGGDYLWPNTEDSFTKTRFDCDPIDPKELGVPQPLIDVLDTLSEEYQTSLDWEYPPDPSPWSFEHFLDFESRTEKAFTDLIACLKDTCEINDRTHSMSSLAQKIIDAYKEDPESDEDTLEKLLEEDRCDWDSILHALQYILLKASDANLFEYAERMIWDAICDGKSLGIDKDSVIALLYSRLGDINAPYDDNVLWSIVSSVKDLDYANDEYNPLKDENVAEYMRKYGFIHMQ